MKLASILVLVGFVIVPFAFLIFRVSYQAFTKRSDAVTKSTSTVPLRPEQLRSQRKILYLVALYGVFFFVAVLWFFLQVIAPSFSVTQRGIIFIAIFMLIMLVAAFIGIFFVHRHILGLNPVPEEGFTAKSRLEWLNKFADIYGKNIGRWILYALGFTLLVLTLFSLVVYYFG